MTRHPSPDQLPLPLEASVIARPISPESRGVAPPASPAPTTPPLDPATARLSDAIPRFLIYSAAIDRSNYTLDAFRLDLSLLVRFLGDRLVRDVTLDDLQRFAAWLRLERKNDARSRRRKVASLKAFFAFLGQEGIRDDDPSHQLIYPTPEPHVPEFLDGDEPERVLAATEHSQWRALLLTFLDTGLKRDEVLALHPADVHLDLEDPHGGYLVVRAADQARRIRARTLRLTPRLARELRQHLDLTPGDRVFPLSVRAINFIVQTCAERAGLLKRGTISPQMLRDTFAVREIRQRVADEDRRRQAGATTAELASLRSRHDREVCDLLGLSDGGTNDPIARYRALTPSSRGTSFAPRP